MLPVSNLICLYPSRVIFWTPLALNLMVLKRLPVWCLATGTSAVALHQPPAAYSCVTLNKQYKVSAPQLLPQ